MKEKISWEKEGKGTLEVLGGLAVQGLSCSDGSNPGKCICRQGSGGHLFTLNAPNLK